MTDLKCNMGYIEPPDARANDMREGIIRMVATASAITALALCAGCSSREDTEGRINDTAAGSSPATVSASEERPEYEVLWHGCDGNRGDGYYTNATYIEVEIVNDWSYDERVDYFYTVDYKGEQICRLPGTHCELRPGNSLDPNIPTEPDTEYLATGEYIITFYDPSDEPVIRLTATVSNEEGGYSPYIEWWHNAQGNVYTNTDGIDCTLNYNGAGLYGRTSSTIEYEGEVVYSYPDSQASCLYTNFEGAPLDPSGQYLAAGEYTVTFYDSDGNYIYSDTCIVHVE